MSKKLEILKSSLEKKQVAFEQKLALHFDDVKSTNGQPLNDKRNGVSTLNRFEKQNSALRNLKDSIQKTSNAIENEEATINWIESNNKLLPVQILNMIETGELIQWKKYPNMFFVAGVYRARIIWNLKKLKLEYKYLNQIPNSDQIALFKVVAYKLRDSISQEKQP